ncbi:MAG: nucleotidyltransferase domain-containing protein [Anaerolineales bacterium]
MHAHHTESIRRTIEFFEKDPRTQALILGGSIAHGLASATSDVDVMILISDEDYQERLQAGQLQFFDRQLCTYPEGYVDGKYLRSAFLRQVAERGSEPARFAFSDARVLFSRVAGLEDLLRACARYPAEGKEERLRRFYAQFEAWNWYAHEALRLNNRYLLGVSIGKLVLFGGRLILTCNEMLYPYHKWLLKRLEQAPDKPNGLLDAINDLYANPSDAAVTAFYERVKAFHAWPAPPAGWPSQFMFDSELNWANGPAPVDDI